MFDPAGTLVVLLAGCVHMAPPASVQAEPQPQVTCLGSLTVRACRAGTSP